MIWAIIIFMGGMLIGIVVAVWALKSPDHNLKLWIQDMRKWLKGKSMSPALKDKIRRKLNELEEI